MSEWVTRRELSQQLRVSLSTIHRHLQPFAIGIGAARRYDLAAIIRACRLSQDAEPAQSAPGLTRGDRP